MCDFGSREMKGVRYLQSRCRVCHNHDVKKEYRRRILHDELYRKRKQGQWLKASRKRLGIGEGVPSRVHWWESLSAEQRVMAMRYGMMDLWDCQRWAARYPREVPIVNGEFEHIALSMADLD